MMAARLSVLTILCFMFPFADRYLTQRIPSHHEAWNRWYDVCSRMNLVFFSEAFFGDHVLSAADQGTGLTFFGGDERFFVFHGHATDVNECQRLGGFLGQRFDALLDRGHFVGMRGGDVVFLVGVFDEVVEVNAGG